MIAPESYRDLTAAARRGCLGPLIGRQRELEQALPILSRRARNNPALVGETGVGRTTIVEAIAEWIADGAVPVRLVGRPVLALDATSLIASGREARRADEVEDMFALVHRHPECDSVRTGPVRPMRDRLRLGRH
jgi:ATP-dependent Clp protease ATP-binding subunit ClpC